MNKDINALITFRLAKSNEALELARFAIQKEYWNSAVSELYYACFYALYALFAKTNINAHTHSGVKTLFSSNFIKEGKVDEKWGKVYSNLFALRQQGDYGDFIYLSSSQVLPFVGEAEQFITVIKKLIQE